MELFMKKVMAIYCLLSILSPARAANLNPEKINFDRTYVTGTVLTLNILRGSTLPKMQKKLTNLFTAKFDCEDVVVKTSVSEGNYFHQIYATIQATCPTTSIVDFALHFNIGVIRGIFRPTTMEMSVLAIDKNRRSSEHVLNLTYMVSFLEPSKR
jgi:hypothetical protein